MHGLGATRSSLKADHLLHTPDAFIRTPLPEAKDVEFIVHIGPCRGAAFTQMTAEFLKFGTLPPAGARVQRFLYVLEGSLDLEFLGARPSASLGPNYFAYLPAGIVHHVRAAEPSRAVLIEKLYQPVNGAGQAAVRTPGLADIAIGDETKLPSRALGGDQDLQVRQMMPDGPTWDFAVNTMTYAPGAALAQVEIHVMEHSLLMLAGGGIYRLGDSWYPVSEGDFIWMAPYCPQWFGALGKTPAKYLIYKDWYRHPIPVTGA